jgi:nitroreductase
MLRIAMLAAKLHAPLLEASCLRIGLRSPAATRVLGGRSISTGKPVCAAGSATSKVREADGGAFERIVSSRQSCRHFDSHREIDPGLMQRVLELTLVRACWVLVGFSSVMLCPIGRDAILCSLSFCVLQRAPSSFNINPYVLVLAHDVDVKRRLSDAMIGEGNAQRVLQAPLTAVFAADIEPARLINETIAMERAAGKSEKYCRGLQTDASAILNGPIVDLPTCGDDSGNSRGQGQPLRGPGATTAEAAASSSQEQRSRQYSRGGGADRDRNVNLLSGHLHSWAQNLKKTAATAASLALGDSAPFPTVNTSEGWTFKNTSIACGYYMLACSAFGLSTHPMEGFDSRLVCKALDIPWPRYAVPMVICTGYPAAAEQAAAEASAPSPRPAFDKMFRLDSFRRPFTALGTSTSSSSSTRTLR